MPDGELLWPEVVLVEVTAPDVISVGLDSLEHATNGAIRTHKAAGWSVDTWSFLMDGPSY